MKKKSRISTTAWPWGRTPPGARMRDISKMIDRTKAQIPIIEDQAREAIRRLEKNIEVLQAQMETARGFLIEEARAENKQIAYELAELGIDRIGRVDEVDDQDALKEELLKLLEEAKQADSISPGGLDDFLDSMHD